MLHGTEDSFYPSLGTKLAISGLVWFHQRPKTAISFALFLIVVCLSCLGRFMPTTVVIFNLLASVMFMDIWTARPYGGRG